MKLSESSLEYIAYICSLYGNTYDDSIEECKPPTAGNDFREAGSDWMPGQTAYHKSLVAFQIELEDMGIKLSSLKIRKILITGGCWTTARSREIGALFDKYTAPAVEGGLTLKSSAAITRIAEELGVSIVTVSINLPYKNAVYKLENSTSNVKRCARYRERKSKGLTRKYKME